MAVAAAVVALAGTLVFATWGSVGPAPRVAPSVRGGGVEASAVVAAPSATGSESLVPLSDEPAESTTTSGQGDSLSDSTPPCRRYYPACGKFSMPGVVADEDCGCRADETCSRTGATGWCIRRPRWQGPQN